MIGVLTLFGDTDLQPLLKKEFIKYGLFFTCENAVTSVQLEEFLNKHKDETDAVIISANAVLLETLPELMDEIHEISTDVRVVLILNGGREQYLKSQLTEFIQRKVDIIFDDHGFDIQVLISFLCKGRLKYKKSNIAFDDSVNARTDYPPGEKSDKPEKNVEEVEESEGDISEGKSQVDNIYEESIEATEEYESDIDNTPESFSLPQKHYSIAVMGAAHGAGATSLVLRFAEFFSLHNFKVAVIDFSGTNALFLTNVKGVDLISEPESIKSLKKKYNLVLADFGVPYNISAKGDRFMLDPGYDIMKLAEINSCSLKFIMGFADSWNVGKLRFFMDNGQWREMIDSSYIFVVPDKADRLKKLYEYNIYERDDDLCSTILELFRQEEFK